LVGHSMGGLVAKLLTTNSNMDFWHLVSSHPLDSLHLPPQDRAELQNLFFFKQQPSVKRIVFIATPHHGSKLSPSLPAQIANRFVHLPKSFMQTASDLAKENPQLGPGFFSGRIPTSIDLLGPKAPALELMAARPRPQGVHYHSIIGEVCGKGEDGSDGVVPYASAHVDDADSEVVIPASHMTLHHHPRAALEVWRILLEHLRDLNGPGTVPAVPSLTLLPETSYPAGNPDPSVRLR